MNRPTKSRLPIITIGGFLGSGKTTLVNKLLSGADGKRLVVFVNDFGAINIDHALIETVEEDRISLSNGCVCCSLNEDLVSSVAEFANADDPPDAVVIEASGVADPKALDSSFSMLEASGAARVDTRVYVLDAEAFGGLNYEDSELIIDHAAASDLVLLNKCDLASLEKLSALDSLFVEAAPYTCVEKTKHCDIPLDFVMSRGNASVPKAFPRAGEGKNTDHTDRYSHWNHETTALIDRKKFQLFAEKLPRYCLRSKGLLRFSDAPDELVSFNLVGVRMSFEKVIDSTASTPSQLVVIGLNTKLSLAEMEHQFSAVIGERETENI